MLRKYYFKIRSSVFAKNAFILTLGTVLAQILPLLTYPILGRLFSPEEFGFLASLNVITPVLVILASGTYENAILLAESREESANIVGMVILRSFIVLVICFLFMFIFSEYFSDFLNEPNVVKWLLISVISAFTIVIYNCYNEVCITNKKFVDLSLNKIFYTSSISVSKIGFGIFNFFGNGLILGEFLGKLFISLLCVFRAFSLERELFCKIQYSRFKEIKKKFSDFPRFLMPDQLLNNIGASIHIFFIGAYFKNSELGFLSMSASLLTVPITVISSAIKDVFRQRAQEEFFVSGSCRSLYLKLFKPIAGIAIFAFIPAYFILPYLFSFFLGLQWTKSGEYSQILLPMFLLNFISMSLGGVLVIAKKTRISLYWQLYTIVITIISFLFGIFAFGDFKTTLYCFMIARSSSYLLYIFLSYYYSKNKLL